MTEPATTRVELPSGAYAELRDPGSLKAKHRKQIMRAMNDADRMGSFAVDMVDGSLAVLIVDWDVCDPDTGEQLPLPSEDLKSLEECSDTDYEALAAEPMVGEFTSRVLQARMRSMAAADDPDGYDDPASPTAPSGGSMPGSTEGSRKPGTPSRKSTSSTKPSGSRSGTAGTKTKSGSSAGKRSTSIR
jgi:hypothetical protein